MSFPDLPLPWIKASEIYFSPSPARMYEGNAVYFGIHVPEPWGVGTPDEWTLVDLKPWGVDHDAIAAFLSGMLIITHGSTRETADLKIVFRKPGDETCDKLRYLGQVIEAAIGGGQRSPMSTWVPLENGCFEFCFQVGTGGVWPEHSAYGANFTPQAWVK